MKLGQIILLMLVTLVGKAQHVVMQSGVEKTVAGFEYGAYASYETKRMRALGGFYQTGLTKNNVEDKLHQKNRFYGMFLQTPIAKSDRLVFLFNLRVGIVNEKFLAMVPSVETRVHLNNRLGLSVGSGFRKGYPSFSAKLFIKLF